MLNVNHREFEAWGDIKTLNTEFWSYIDYFGLCECVCECVCVCKCGQYKWPSLILSFCGEKQTNEAANNIWAMKLTIIRWLLNAKAECTVWFVQISNAKHEKSWHSDVFFSKHPQLTSTLNCQILLTKLLTPQNHCNNCLCWTIQKQIVLAFMAF